ncbi:MAG: dihydroorotase [Bryobacterales bacterium]|nr:dihydroorotase [Bryobacteraceae bacterium]MDW8130915.1 dihydroorotase [Bryobacterales bacterium]
MPKLLIRNGRVMDPATGLDQVADILIKNGLIVRIGPNLHATGAIAFDATGLVVAPGFIDLHTHLREPGYEHAETIETGTKAAAAGGFTTVCAMPNTNPVNDDAAVTRYILEQAERFATTNVLPIGAITENSEGESLAAIGSMKAAGAVAISDDGRPVMNSRVMRRAMEFARAFDLVVIDHCEDLNLSAGGDMHEGEHSVRLGLRGIPSVAEDIMVARDLLLVELTGARLHVAHVSSARSLAMIAEAKRRGLPVTCEVTPHHIALTDAHLAGYDSNFKMKPPLRSAADRDALIEGIASGVVDAIATDHAPHPGSEKMQEFEKCPFGVTGLETALGVALQTLVHPGKISLMRLIELFTTGPARVLGLNRARLEPGGVADLTIFDPEMVWTFDVNRSFSKSKNSPFHGWTFRGGPVATVVKGRIVWQRSQERS